MNWRAVRAVPIGPLHLGCGYSSLLSFVFRTLHEKLCLTGILDTAFKIAADTKLLYRERSQVFGYSALRCNVDLSTDNESGLEENQFL